MYLDVRTALGEALEKGLLPGRRYPVMVGGRYGLGSKDFSPAMVRAVYDNLAETSPKNRNRQLRYVS